MCTFLCRTASATPERDVQPLEMADLGWILEIEHACFSCPWTAIDFQRAVCAAGAVAKVVQLGADRVGYALGQVLGAGFHLTRMAIAPGYRRRGWGTGLLGALLAHVHESGCQTCHLEVRSGNAAARALYRKLGFRSVSLRRSYYTDPVEDAIVLQVYLVPFVS